MTVPPLQLQAFHPAYADRIEPGTQVDRMPGTPDALCLCFGDDRPTECKWPWCVPPKEDDE